MEPEKNNAELIKLLLLSVVVGACAGLGAMLLVSLLQCTSWLFLGKLGGVAISGAANEPEPFRLPEIIEAARPYALILLPALGGLVSGLLTTFIAPEAAGHGTDSAIESYHFRGGRVRPVAIPVKTIATSILIGTGGSAGCEGPITQIGAGFGSMISNALGLSVSSRRKLMAAGMGAGVGALFHAPLAGAIFAAEMLYRDLDLEYEVLVPAIVASVTSSTLFSRVFGFCPLFEMPPESAFGDPKMLVLYIALAFMLAFGARFYTWCFYTAHERFSGLKIPLWIRPAIGGLVTGIIGFHFVRVLGSGYGTIQEALRCNYTFTITAQPRWFCILLGVFFLKTLTTSFSVGSGGSGGIFGPALVVGGCLGGAVGMLFATIFPSWHVPVCNFVLVGMVAFFGCAAKTPISTIIMISEMTGNFRLLVPSMWVCILAYLLSRQVSLYRSQLPNRFEAPVHRSSLIAGTLGAILVRDVLAARTREKPRTVTYGDPLAVACDILLGGRQDALPVLAADGSLAAVLTRSDLASVESSDPMLRMTLLVDDVTPRKHPVIFESEPLRSVLAKMDEDDAEGMVVVSSDSPRRPIAVVSHNDIAAAYQREMAVAR